MKKKLLISLIILCACSCFISITAAQPEADWTKTYGDVMADAANSVQVTSDGGYIIAGTTMYGENQRAGWLVKVDSEGKYEWSQRVGGGDYIGVKSILVTSDGGYIMAGRYDTRDDWRTDVWLLKTDPDGAQEWSEHYYRFGDEWADSIQKTPDGGYIVSGMTNYKNWYNPNIYVAKFSSDGGLESDLEYNLLGRQRGLSIQNTPNGGYIVAGTSGGESIYLIKLAGDFGPEWSRYYEGYKGNSVQVAPDGGYVVAGSSDGGVTLMKTYPDGLLDWSRTYGGISGNSLQVTPDGGYIIAGNSTEGVFLVKTDVAGNMEWSKTYGGKTGNSIQIIDDGGYIIAGTTETSGAGWKDFYLVCTDREPNAGFSVSPVAQFEGTPVTFTDTSTSHPDSLVSWSWDIGGLETLTDQNPSFTFMDDGVYTINLTVIDEDGSIDRTSRELNISDRAPAAEFTSSPLNPVKGEPVSFTDQSTSAPDEIVAWDWSFSEDTSSTSPNPVYTFTDEGKYTVTLTVTDDDGSTGTVTHTVTVAHQPPTAVFSSTPEPQDEGSPVQFTDKSSPPEEIESYSWDFAGLESSTEQNPVYTFMEDGEYTVTLQVTDSAGLSSSFTGTVTVNDLQPTAGFSWSPESFKAGTAVTFTDKSSCYPDEIVSRSWDFGDGSSPSSDANPSHTYTKKGSYTVEMTVTDTDGDVDTASFTLTVAAKPFPIGILLGVLVIAAAAAAYYFLVLKKKKGAAASMLRVTVSPTMLPADGRSTAEVTVEVLDEAGVSTEVAADTPVNIAATLGTVRSPVTIAEGSSSASSTLSAGFDIGTSNVSAEAPGLKTGTVTIQLVERRRYCMHCGSQMPLNENTCPKCGKVPPSGVEVKECMNCGVVIPSVAAFCGECGAGQPKEAEAPEDE